MASMTRDAEENRAQIQEDIQPRYKLGEVVGSGSHGVVMSATDLESQGLPDRVAIKRIVRGTLHYEGLVRVLREVLLMKHLHHTSLLSLRDLFLVNGCVYIVTDLMESDLFRVSCTDQKFSERHVKYFIFQLLSALHHMHSAGVIHRDVKPSNILVNANCKLKLGDLGLSREIVSGAKSPSARGEGGSVIPNAAHLQPHPRTHHGYQAQRMVMTEYVCTRWYRAPELLMQSKIYNELIDCWSAGCVGVELLTRQPLFPGRNTMDQLEKIVDVVGQPHTDSLPPTCPQATRDFLTSHAPILGPQSLTSLLTNAAASPEMIDLLTRMLVFDPSQRLGVAEALAHPALQEFAAKIPPTQPVDRFFFSDLPESHDDLVKLLEKSARFSIRTRSAASPSAKTM